MKKIFSYSIVLIILFSCKRENKEFLGPAFISASNGFVVNSFTGSPSPVDFTLTSVYFNASFSNSVTWKLTIMGNESCAKKDFVGISNSVINLEWKGTHDGVYFFKKGETVTATLTFFGTTYTSVLNILISKPRNFTTYGQFPLIGDFENPLLVEPQPPLYSPYWASFNYPTPIANVNQGCDSAAVDYNGNLVPSVQGKKYYFIKGKGAQAAFVSGIQYFGALTPVMPADPDNVWVNIYIYGTGDANAGVELEYQEADFDGTQSGYQGTDDDAFTAKFSLGHKGWKLFSFKYSSLTPSLNAPFGGSGNKKHEPEKLISFDLVLVKKLNPTASIEVYFDYPIITVGGPFNPSK